MIWGQIVMEWEGRGRPGPGGGFLIETHPVFLPAGSLRRSKPRAQQDCSPLRAPHRGHRTPTGDFQKLGHDSVAGDTSLWELTSLSV